MKKTLLFLFLTICGFTHAQIINIPDANFKNALIMHGIDLNANLQIEESEALAYSGMLSLSNQNIADMTGIEAFLNVTQIDCQDNNLTSLDVSALANLQILWCYNNNIVNLNVNGLSQLIDLGVGFNPLTSIDLTGVDSLEYLALHATNLVTVDIFNKPFLQSILIDHCPLLTTINGNGLPMLSGINANDCPQLQHISLVQNSLTDAFVELTNCPNIQTIDFSQSAQLSFLNLVNFPNLTSVNVSDSPMLSMLWTGSANLASINLNGLPMLNNLSIQGGTFSSIGLSDLPSMMMLLISGNENLEHIDLGQLTGLAVAQLNNNKLSSVVWPATVALSTMDVSGNEFTHLDLSMLPALIDVYASDNPLETLNIKNGNTETTLVLDNTATTLQHICADESQIAAVQAVVPTAEVNSYCSFVPGGGFNTITGTVRYDADANGCDTSDPYFPIYSRIDLAGGPFNYATTVDVNGVYNFYVGAGNFTVTPALEHPEYFNIAPASGNAALAAAEGLVTTIDFCIAPIGETPDLEVIVTGTPARAGFDVNYMITYKNNGTTTQSGTIDLTFDDARTDFTGATPANDTQSANHLIWNFTDLHPFEVRTILFTLHTNSPTDELPLNIGDILGSSVAITGQQPDQTPADNVSTLSQTVINSYDPNTKTCLEGDTVTTAAIGGYLHYDINFENIGTSDAINVVVKDLINTDQFDLSTLQIMYASHPVRVLVTDNKIEFLFENINLPPSAVNPIGGHGNVLFKIKTLPTLSEGDVVTNTASIYFDYNHPIDTNEARTTFAVLNRQVFVADNSVSVYPNPAKNTVTIKAISAIRSISLFDVQGRLLETQSGNATAIDLSGKPKGLYFLKVTTTNGAKIEKIIKE